MIKVRILEYTQYKQVNIDITRYINDNIKRIIDVIIDLIENDYSMEEFFPRDFIEREPIACKKMIYELYENVSSNVIRDFIKPKYEDLLYRILSWWKVICIDNPDLDLIKPPSESLIKEILADDYYIDEVESDYLIEIISDYNNYFDFLFSDHDFDSETLGHFTTFYLRSPDSKEFKSKGINLDDYIDLMPSDLRELYLEKTVSNISDMKTDIVLILQQIIERLENRVVQLETKTEIEISDEIYTTLSMLLESKYNLNCSREMTIGRATKQLGETDLYIYGNDDSNNTGSYSHITIIENKVIEKFEEQYKQLLGYLNHNFKFGITLSINKNFERYKAIDLINKKLNKLKNESSSFKITDICQPFSKYSNIIASTHIIPEEPSRKMIIYHLVLNLYDVERKTVALEARK